MFETSVIRVQARAADRRFGLLSVSLAAHAVVILGVLAASIRTVEFPSRAPNEYALPFMAAPVQLPPALGTPHPKPAAQAAQPVQKPATTPAQITAPSTMPEHATPVASAAAAGESTTTDAGTDATGPVGVPWGVDGGVDTHPQVVDAPVDAGPMRVGFGVTAPVVIQRVSPVYPRAAIAAKLNGAVTVEAIIDKSGRVREAHVIRSTSAIFDQAALDAVRQWVFAPGTYGGRAVDTIFQLNVSFQVR